jgi:hypothetical protein
MRRGSIFGGDFQVQRMAARLTCCIFNSKASSVTNTTTTESNINNVDNRVGEAGAVFGGNISVSPTNSPISSLQISSTDQGALKVGGDLALRALDLVQANSETNAASSDKQISQAYGLAQAARQSETSGAINNFLKYGAIVAGLALLAFIFVRSRK